MKKRFDKMVSQAIRAMEISLVLIFVFALPAAFIAGCRHVNNSNPAVVKAVTLLDAENTVNSIAHGLQAANGTLKNLQATEPDYYAYAHPKLVEIARLNDRANNAIVKAKNGDVTIDWRSEVVAVGTLVTDPKSLTTFGFKNPKSQSIVQVSFAALVAGLSLAASFGGK